MDNYIVSARKYRPQNWDSVVGQKSITKTLQNAIAKNHLAQAFLFCGPRGVGKTTTARILAKAVNESTMPDATEQEQDFAFNIFELDAASNNSVDDIRSLIDQVRIPPQVGDYKVYIIDEVHMLSAAAFNAFLKTLEEPPAYAIFILATTEKHKVLPTILSRCQTFDFHRITIEDMVDHLSGIAKKEGIEAEERALHLIAKKADGGMRDALSLFDQMVSFAGNNLTYQAVLDNLNLLDYEVYFELVNHIQNSDSASALLMFDDILERGFEGHIFLNGLAEHLRNLLVAADPKTAHLVESSSEVKEQFQKQAQLIDPATILDGLTICNELDHRYRTANNSRLLIELGILQLCSLNSAEKKKP